MIMNLRKRSKLIMFIVLISFVALMVLGWGADITGRRSSGGRRKAKADVLAAVGKEDITPQDYSAAYSRLVNQIGEETWKQLGENERKELSQAAWEEAVNDAVWKETIKREQTTLGDKELDEIVMLTPPEPLTQDTAWLVNGQFNYELYWQMLNDPNLPPQTRQFIDAYKTELGREILRTKIRSDVTHGFRLTRAQVADAQLSGGSKMQLEALFVYEAPPVDTNVSNPEIESYYKENIKDFEREKWWELRTIWFPLYPSSEDTTFLKERVDDAVAALKTGYDFEQIALDFTRDSSMLITRPVDLLTAKEYDILNPLAENQVSEPFFTMGGWHLVKMIKRGSDSLTFRDVYFRLEAGDATRKQVMESIEEFRKRAPKENLDSLLVEYKLTSRNGPFVRETKDLVLPNFPYSEAAQTYAIHSKIGDISEPFPEVNGVYYLFATVDVTKQETTPLDSNIEFIKRMVIRERAKNAQREYAFKLKHQIEQGSRFGNLVGLPHVSIDTLNFSSYFEAETRYGAEMAGACYTLDVGQMTGPVKCDIGYGFFRCVAREFDPTSSMVQTAVQNEQTVILNAMAEDIFRRGDLQDYRTAYNYYEGN